jgi:RecB family exonuclease
MENKRIICPGYLKDYLLSVKNGEEKVRIYAEEEAKELLTFRSEPDALYYVYEKYASRSLAYAKKLLENAKNLKTSVETTNPKILKLKEIRTDLIAHNLLYEDLSGLYNLKNGSLTLIGLSSHAGLKKLLKDRGLSCEEKEVCDVKARLKTQLIAYPDFRLEAADAIVRIAALLKEGVAPEEIGVALNPKLMDYLEGLAEEAGFSFSYPYLKVADTPYFHEVMNNLAEKGVSSLAFEPDDGYKGQVSSQIIKCLSQVKDIPSADFVTAYLKDFASSAVVEPFFGIKLASSFKRLVLSEYVFFLGFDDSYPGVVKDKDYLSDEEKEKYSFLEGAKSTAEQSKDELLSALHLLDEKKLTMSYSSSSPLLGQCNINRFADSTDKNGNTIPGLFAVVPYEQEEELSQRPSLKDDEMLFAALKYDNETYGEDSKYYETLKKNLSDKAKSFFPDNKNPSYRNPDLKVSYSSLTDFAKCPYSYLIKYIYGIKDEDDEDYTMLKGTFFHKIVEVYGREQRIISEKEALEESQVELEKMPLKDRFYFHKVYLSALIFIEDLKKLVEAGDFSFPLLTEHDFEQPLQKETRLVGKIDAVLSGSDHYIIVDYKTGNHKFSLDDAVNGFDMQLIIYGLSLQKEAFFASKELTGLYYAMPFPNDYLYTFVPALFTSGYQVFNGADNETFLKAKDKDTLGKFISKGRLPSVEKEALFDLVDKKTEELAGKIREGSFPVQSHRYVKPSGSPKKDMCQFCRFKDCCYLNANDKEQIVGILTLKDQLAQQEGKPEESSDDEAEEEDS